MNIARPILSILVVAFSLTLVACFEGGSDTPSSLSGTAAAGAPIIGTVTVKGALGNEVSAPIEVNGNYNIDVTGLTAPYRLRAEGTIGGKIYRLYSYAEEADLGGTVNITPFTDLIVANAAGQIAETYFNRTNPEPLDPLVLDEQEAALKIKLQSVFKALSVDDTVSLLYSAFSADHTGLDAVLDAVRIEPSTLANTYTIQNYLDGTTITDVVTSLTDTGSLSCATESGWDTAINGGLGAPVTPYSFSDFETVVKDCGALDLSMIIAAGSVFSSGSETITLNNTGTGTLHDSIDNTTIIFQWYVEQASCDGCTHSYIVLYTNTTIDPGLPAGFWYRQTAALTGISGDLGEYYSYVNYREQSNYSDIDRPIGIDGEIWHETLVLN